MMSFALKLQVLPRHDPVSCHEEPLTSKEPLHCTKDSL